MKSILIGALLLLASNCRADMHYFNFEWKGFETKMNEEQSVWDPGQILSGFFAGDDRNSDEQISRDELTALIVNGRDFSACAGTSPPPGCSVGRFVYRPGEVVQLEVYISTSTEYSFTSDRYQTFDSGVSFYHHFHRTDDHFYDIDWNPTLGTSYSLIPTIPEPSVAAMSLAGLVVLAGLRRRIAGKCSTG